LRNGSIKITIPEAEEKQLKLLTVMDVDVGVGSSRCGSTVVEQNLPRSHSRGHNLLD
jgi:hypothetical protein